MINKYIKNNLNMDFDQAETYLNLKKEYDMYLKPAGVKFPKIGSAKYYWLLILYEYKGFFIPKEEIAIFTKKHKKVSGDQQVRHLAADGWYSLNKNERLPNTNLITPRGHHMLFTVEMTKPNYLRTQNRRLTRIHCSNFEELKELHNHSCATCGNKEGEPDRNNITKMVTLQQGHKDPRLDLTIDNCIPQCDYCNQTYKGDYIFNDEGRIVGIATLNTVMKADADLKKEIYNYLLGEYLQKED